MAEPVPEWNPFPPPDPGLVNSVADLASALRLLRISAGAPTLRVLASRATKGNEKVAHSTLGNAESGRILPGLEVVEAFVRACGVPDDQIQRWLEARQRAYASRYVRSTAMGEPHEYARRWLAEMHVRTDCLHAYNPCATCLIPAILDAAGVEVIALASARSDTTRTAILLPVQRHRPKPPEDDDG